jgi:serine/threonine-protein kinase
MIGSTVSPVSLVPGTPVGRYVIRRKLAEGGMAEIFLAQSRGPEGFEKQVVIKRIRAPLADDPSFVQMFIAEARVASKLNHANIVHIFDFDQHQDTYYLAMEYVRGKSLAEVHRRARTLGRSFPQVLAAQVALEVARGLAYAHKLTDHGQPLGLVHRDVTPHNVLVSYDGAVKLTDFGIAKASNRASTAGMLKGKFAYMAPEQARGEAVDARTDIFALGITLWELLSGARLFDGDSDLAVLRAVQDREIISPAVSNPEVTPALAQLVMRALHRDPARRFQTAGELERALLQHVISATHSPEDTDVGLFVRSLFPDEASADEDSEPAVPLRLVPESGSSAPRSAPAASWRTAGYPPASELLHTVRSGGHPLPPEGDPYAPTSAKTPNRPGGATTPGVQSAVTQSPPEEGTGALAASFTRRGRGARWALLGAAVLLGVAGIAFVAGRSGSREASPVAPAGVPPPAEPRAAIPPPAPGTVPDAPRVEAPRPPAAAGPPGYLQVSARPWGKLYVDDKFMGDVEGSRRFTVPSGLHDVRLTNGRKVRNFPQVEVKPGKATPLGHSFLDD